MVKYVICASITKERGEFTELQRRSCVKVSRGGRTVLGSPSITVRTVSVDALKRQQCPPKKKGKRGLGMTVQVHPPVLTAGVARLGCWPSFWASYDSHTPSIAFRHLPPNSARFGYATEEALFISAQLSSDAVSALRKVRVLIRLW